MRQDLPNLVDERRLRRNREPDDVQRDERGRVSFVADASRTVACHGHALLSPETRLLGAVDKTIKLTLYRESGPRNEFLSTWNRSLVSTSELK